MLRSSATRSLLRSFTKVPTAKSIYSAASPKFNNASLSRTLSYSRPHVLPLTRPTAASVFYATKSGPPFDRIDEKHEHDVAEKKIKPHPDEVSEGSSVRHVFEEAQAPKEEHGGIRADLETIKDTFALTDVPKESLYIGAAGVLPYAATSLSTVYLAFDINHAHATGQGYLFSPETAHQLLDLITPIQVGYGAVIISFLGAIHWGLEYAGYGGHQSYRRYMYGVVAPAVAWPTIMMPVEYALITQFAAFTFLYFADARATVRGWFPHWYSTYRFVLTFIVGASIVVSLVGRGRIAKSDSELKNPVDYIKTDRDNQWLALEQEEKERRKKIAEEEKAEEEEEEEEEGEDEGDKKEKE